MKAYLLWDRFLSFWLPPERRTGDRERDIGEALRATYGLPSGRKAVFALKGGLSTIVVTEESTLVASRIPPHPASPVRPNWLDWRGALSGADQRALLDGEVRDLFDRPRPHIILRTGRRPFTLQEIVLGEGTGVVVNEPGRVSAVDSVRIGRARRALEVFGSAARMQKALRLIRKREAEAGETASIDGEIRREIARLKIGIAAFFDALDLLDGVSAEERKLAERSR